MHRISARQAVPICQVPRRAADVVVKWDDDEAGPVQLELPDDGVRSGSRNPALAAPADKDRSRLGIRERGRRHGVSGRHELSDFGGPGLLDVELNEVA